MWKQAWRKWTIDSPADFGDWLWDIFVVQLAAFLDRLTLRQVIAFIPVVILILAYMHRIPIPPELMLVGDILAYLDIFSLIFLVSALGRVATVLFIARRALARCAELMSRVRVGLQRLDFRHRREAGAANRKRLSGLVKKDDDDYAIIRGAAWA